MLPISERLRIYRISFEELTMKQIRENFRNWEDQDRLGGLIAFYDRDEDKLLIGPGAVESQVNFCVKALSADRHDALDRLNQFIKQSYVMGNAEMCQVLKFVINERMQMSEHECDNVANPNSKFISIAGVIFQISKIVSVKKRDDGNRHIIEFYITNKKASVRKEFSSQQLRNSEYQRIQKILEMIS